MKFRSVGRLLVGVLLVGAYYIGPAFFGPKGSSPVNVNLGKVDRIKLSGHGGGDAEIVRKGRYWYTTGGARGDDSLALNLLDTLAVASWSVSSESVPADAPKLTLMAGNKGFTLALGKRLEPFKRQLVQAGGTTYEIDRDLSALVSIWEGPFPKGPFNLADPIAIDLRQDPVVRATFGNPFADITIAGQDDSWTLKTGINVRPHVKNCQSQAEKMTWVTVDGMMTDAQAESIDCPLTFAYQTAGKIEVKGRVSLRQEQPDAPMQSRHFYLVKLEAPVQANYRVDAQTMRRLAPRSSTLIENLPQVQVDPRQITEVEAWRGRHHLHLRKQGRGWEMVKPNLPYRFAKFDAGPGGGGPSDAAEAYVEQIATVISEEPFAPDTQARKQLVRQGFNQVAARIRITTAGGGTTEMACSADLGLGNARLVRHQGKYLVVSTAMGELWVPSLATLFDAQQIQGKDLPW